MTASLSLTRRKSPQIQTSDILLLTLFVCCFFGSTHSDPDEGEEIEEEGEGEGGGPEGEDYAGI